MHSIAAWTLFLLLGGLSVYATLFNAACALYGLIKGRGPSVAPFIGGLAGAAALRFAPLAWLRPYWWMPVVLDCSYALFLVALPKILRELWQFSRFNLLQEYRGNGPNGCEIRLQLFRKSACLILVTFVLKPGETGLSKISMAGNCRKVQDRLHVDLGHAQLEFEVLPHGAMDLAGVSGDAGVLKLLLTGERLRLKMVE